MRRTGDAGRSLPAHAAYTLLAPRYDRLFGDYARRLAPWVRRWVRTLEPRPAAALELATGSGRIAAALSAVVPDVLAVDRNPDFLSQTVKRAPRVTAVRGDMRTFRAPRRVDLVTCFFDSINHLSGRGDLPLVFRAVHRALRPGGLFLFDVNTPYALQAVWPQMKAIWRGRGWFAVGRGHFEPAPSRGGRKAPLATGSGTFEIHWFTRRPDGNYAQKLEVFREVAWTAAEIRAALRGAGFDYVRRLDDPLLKSLSGPGGRARAFHLARRGD